MSRRGRVDLARELPAPQRSSDHGEQRAHFPFGDVTAQHGGADTPWIDNDQ